MINKIFNISLGISLTLSIVESVTYLGFWHKHLGLNVIYFYLLTITIGFLSLIVGIKTKVVVNRLTYHFQIFSLSIASVIFVLLKILNRFIHPNFVFSKIHIQPDNLIWVLILISTPFVVSSIQKIYLKKESRLPFSILIICLLLIFFNLFKVYKITHRAIIYMLKNPRATYSQKMGEKIGSTFYNFTQFINKYTPQTASLLMPPQAFPWPQSGNGAFLRYFVYPRNLGNGQEYKAGETTDLKNIDYVLLTWGETETTEPPYTHGWPKFDVPAEKVILMNLDGSFNSEIVGNYKYSDYKDKKVWGLIKVKH